MNVKPRLLFVLLTAALAACSSDGTLLQSKVDYRSGSDNLSKNNLEVPPDLTAPASSNVYVLPGKAAPAVPVAKAQDTAAETTTTAAPTQKARLVEAGGQRWLVVQGEPSRIWPEIREFWLDNGFLLTTDNPSIGIMETDWQENRAKLPQDWVTRMLSKVANSVLSTGEIDKFRTRIEAGSAPGTTEIYISHRGKEEVYADGSKELGNGNDVIGKTVWTNRPSDPELEAEMLALMLQRLGMTPEQAQAVIKPSKEQAMKARLVNDGLVIDDTFDRAWRRVGLALDREGYVVYDRNRSEGVYYVRRAETDIAAEENSSFWSKFSFGKDDDAKKRQLPEYEIRLAPQVSGTRLTVAGKDGATIDAESRNKLLSALQSQLR